MIVAAYAVIIGLNEWRLQRHVQVVRAADESPGLVQSVVTDPPGGIGG